MPEILKQKYRFSGGGMWNYWGNLIKNVLFIPRLALPGARFFLCRLLLCSFFARGAA